jgi:hypothetical protein
MGIGFMGLVCFAVLMALRSAVSGIVARGLFAAVAFVCLAVTLVFIGRAWKR